MEENKICMKLVFKLPSKDKKAAVDVEGQKEAQSFGSSSSDPIVNSKNMKKLQNGSRGCDMESRSSRFYINMPLKLMKVSQETNNDQEQQPRLEKVTQGTNNDQEKQPRIEEVPDKTRNDQEVEKLIEKTENQQDEGKKMDALDGELSKNFRVEEAEEKEKEKWKRKRGFTIALSEEQIEEDILRLLGPKASRRRAKKGFRASRHPLNHLFPGAWIDSLID